MAPTRFCSGCNDAFSHTTYGATGRDYNLRAGENSPQLRSLCRDSRDIRYGYAPPGGGNVFPFDVFQAAEAAADAGLQKPNVFDSRLDALGGKHPLDDDARREGRLGAAR